MRYGGSNESDARIGRYADAWFQRKLAGSADGKFDRFARARNERSYSSAIISTIIASNSFTTAGSLLSRIVLTCSTR